MQYKIKDFDYNVRTRLLSCKGVLIYDYTSILKNTHRIIGRISEAYHRDHIGCLRYRDNKCLKYFYRDVFLFYYIRDYMIECNIQNIDEFKEYFQQRGFYDWFQESISCCTFRKFPD